MTRITPCLWFDGNAAEAATFYTKVFPDSHIDKVFKTPSDTPGNQAGDVLTVEFTIGGQPFVGLNGGPDFRFNEAISFVIECKDQAEVDRYWDALLQDGGEPSICGWLKDRFGVSWQVTPKRLLELTQSQDRDGAKRAMEAMLKMRKIDIATIESAYRGEPVTV
jgi:predicted 3-demethylubiquinone-9 3-methyltransferase (glyoxalase superfamily)